MLKTLVGLAASKNLASEKQRLPGDFDSDIDLAELLQNPEQWKSPTGMYFTQKLGAEFRSSPDLALAPLSRREVEHVVGMIMAIQGFAITLLATPAVVLEDAGLAKAAYHIEKINFHMQRRHSIQLSWEKRLNT